MRCRLAALLLVLAGCTPPPAAGLVRLRDGMPLVRVPGGPYASRPYEPRATTEAPRAVEVPGFLMDQYEVSNAQFARFLAETGTGESAEVDGETRPVVKEQPWGLRRTGRGWIPQPGYDDHPAVGVTGWGALLYARWAGGSLPTADQWMKAAGGPEGLEYPFGPWAGADSPCNWNGRQAYRTFPVAAFPEGASPYGCLNMAGNVYERVAGSPRGLPVLLKGGAWLTAHPLNLRVLDLCMQPMEAAEASVGFRCAMPEDAAEGPGVGRRPLPAAPPSAARGAQARPPADLRLPRTLKEGLGRAKALDVPVLLSLHYDTCGQCDRVRAELFTDPAFVKGAGKDFILLVGQRPGDAGDRPHPPGPGGRCPLFPGLACAEHEALFDAGLALVGGFRISPGNFVLGPDGTVLVGEEDLPKSGDRPEDTLARIREARARLRP